MFWGSSPKQVGQHGGLDAFKALDEKGKYAVYP